MFRYMCYSICQKISLEFLYGGSKNQSQVSRFTIQPPFPDTLPAQGLSLYSLRTKVFPFWFFFFFWTSSVYSLYFCGFGAGYHYVTWAELVVSALGAGITDLCCQICLEEHSVTLEINFSDLVRFTPFELVSDSQSSFCLYHPCAGLKFMPPGSAAWQILACLCRLLLDLLIFLVYITCTVSLS